MLSATMLCKLLKERVRFNNAFRNTTATLAVLALLSSGVRSAQDEEKGNQDVDLVSKYEIHESFDSVVKDITDVDVDYHINFLEEKLREQPDMDRKELGKLLSNEIKGEFKERATKLADYLQKKEDEYHDRVPGAQERYVGTAEIMEKLADKELYDFMTKNGSCTNDEAQGFKLAHWNILATGLSQRSSGFAICYKEDARKFDMEEIAESVGLFKPYYQILEDEKTLNDQVSRKQELDYLGALMGAFDSKYEMEIGGKKVEITKITKLSEIELLTKEINKTANKADRRYTTQELQNIFQHIIVAYKKWEFMNLIPVEMIRFLLSTGTKIQKDLEDWTTTMGISFRFSLILAMILDEEPDMITMVELDVYEEYYKKIFEILGYNSTFESKVGGKKGETAKLCPGLSQYNKTDGAAIFWKTSMFEPLKPVITHEPEKYHEHAPRGSTKNIKAVENYPVNRKFGKKSNIDAQGKATIRVYHNNIHLGECHGAQVAIDMSFQTKNEAPQVFSIVTGHMKSGKVEKDIKKKCNGFLKLALRVRELHHDEGLKQLTLTDTVPVIISGDMNTDGNTEAWRRFLAYLNCEIVCSEKVLYGKKPRTIMRQNEQSYTLAPVLKVMKDGTEKTIAQEVVVQRGEFEACQEFEGLDKQRGQDTRIHDGKEIDMNKKLICEDEFIFEYFTERIVFKPCPMTSVYGEDYYTKYGWRKGGEQPHKIEDAIVDVEDRIMLSAGLKYTTRMELKAVEGRIEMDGKEWYGEDFKYYAPNVCNPSDHIMLACSIEFTNLNKVVFSGHMTKGNSWKKNLVSAAGIGGGAAAIALAGASAALAATGIGAIVVGAGVLGTSLWNAVGNTNSLETYAIRIFVAKGRYKCVLVRQNKHFWRLDTRSEATTLQKIELYKNMLKFDLGMSTSRYLNLDRFGLLCQGKLVNFLEHHESLVADNNVWGALGQERYDFQPVSLRRLMALINNEQQL